MLKKAWNWIKKMYNAATTLEEEVAPQVVESNSIITVTPLAYWAEYSEHVKMAERVKQYEEQQAKIALQLESEAIRAWKENNAMVDEYFKRGRVRKTHLRVVNS